MTNCVCAHFAMLFVMDVVYTLAVMFDMDWEFGNNDATKRNNIQRNGIECRESDLCTISIMYMA